MFFTAVLFILILITMPLNGFGRQRNRVLMRQTPWIPSPGDPCSFSASHTFGRWSELNFCLSILITKYLTIFPSLSNPTLHTTPNMHFLFLKCTTFCCFYFLVIIFFRYLHNCCPFKEYKVLAYIKLLTLPQRRFDFL